MCSKGFVTVFLSGERQVGNGNDSIGWCRSNISIFGDGSIMCSSSTYSAASNGINLQTGKWIVSGVGRCFVSTGLRDRNKSPDRYRVRIPGGSIHLPGILQGPAGFSRANLRGILPAESRKYVLRDKRCNSMRPGSPAGWKKFRAFPLKTRLSARFVSAFPRPNRDH